MTSRTITASVAILFVVGLGAYGFASAQQPRQPSDPVLRELQMMRQTLDSDLVFQMQIQVAAARATAAQLVVASLGIELANVRSQLSEIGADLTRAGAAVKRMESQVPAGTDINQRMPIGEQYYVFKTQVETGQQRQQQLQARESQIVALMSAEQARLDAANRRLDELERAVTTRR